MKYFGLSKSPNLVSLLLFSIIVFKFYIVFIPFGSTDLSGLSQRYLFLYNSFDWSKTGENLLPYFPFVEIIYFYTGKIADFLRKSAKLSLYPIVFCIISLYIVDKPQKAWLNINKNL